MAAASQAAKYFWEQAAIARKAGDVAYAEQMERIASRWKMKH